MQKYPDTHVVYILRSEVDNNLIYCGAIAHSKFE